MRLNGFNLLHNIDKTDSVHLVGALLIFLTILSLMNFYALMFSLDRTFITHLYMYMYVEYAFLESTVFVFVDLKNKNYEDLSLLSIICAVCIMPLWTLKKLYVKFKKKKTLNRYIFIKIVYGFSFNLYVLCKSLHVHVYIILLTYMYVFQSRSNSKRSLNMLSDILS